MPIQPSIDDTNTTLITYQGTWDLLVGSSRQWNSTVHSTLTPGSSATFSFRGYQVWVWGTIPAGVGNSSVDFSIDGGTPNVTSLASNTSDVYNEQYYASPLLQQTFHTIVVTNRGSNANGNAEFMLDRFEFVSSDTDPVFTTSSSVSITPTSTPSSSATGTSRSVTSSGGSKTPLGAIAGAVIGVLVLIIVALAYLLWRRRKGRVEDTSSNEKSSTGALPRASALVPTPFPLNDSVPSETNSPANPQSGRFNVANPILSEKSSYRAFQPGSIPSNSPNNAYTDSNERQSLPTALASSTTSLGTTSSNPQFPPIATATSLMNDGASSMYTPHTVLGTVRSPLSDVASASASHTFEQPPPSYSGPAVSGTNIP